MASAKKFPNSPAWYACYKIPTGQVGPGGRPMFKRVQRSTGLTDPEDKDRARQLAISYERAAKLVAQKRWSEKSAHRFLAELQAIGGIEILQVEQTERFLLRWLEAKKKTVKPKSWQNFNGIISDFIEWLGPRKADPLVEITPHLVAEFRDAEIKLGKAGTTVNKALSVLGQAFEEAVTQMSLERNPARGLLIKNADKNAQARKAFSFGQFRELVRRTGPGEKSKRGNEAHPDWQTFILATGYTGGRQQEVAKLEWANVDLAGKMIGLVRRKNNDVHWMPLHSALHKHLSALAEATPASKRGQYVTPYLAGLEEREISKAFRETILPRVDIVQPYAKRTDEKGVGRKLAPYSIHSLRHSLSTWLNDAGVTDLMRLRLVGHENEDVNRKYTHTELTQAAVEMEKIPTV